MRVFLSHQSADTLLAWQIRDRLKSEHAVDSYLDEIDPHLEKAGDDLARHLQNEISKCTHLLAVTSYNTRNSQRVPWEIGIATEKKMPLATFANYISDVPEFLQAWPYLKKLEDVDKYVYAAVIERRVAKLNETKTEASIRQSSEFQGFYIKLRQELGQPITRAK